MNRLMRCVIMTGEDDCCGRLPYEETMRCVSTGHVQSSRLSTFGARTR